MTIQVFASDTAVYAAASEAITASRRVMSLKEIAAAGKAAIKSDAAVASLPVALAGQGSTTLKDVTEKSLADAFDGAERLVVSALGQRGIVCEDGEKRDGIVGFAIYPAYSVDDILGHAAGKEYLERLAAKEMGHIAHRRLRGIEGISDDDFAARAIATPTALDDFLLRATVGGGKGSAADALSVSWGTIKKVLLASPAMAAPVRALPAKAELIKCVRSASYAAATQAASEEHGNFVKIAQIVCALVEQSQAAAAEDDSVTALEGNVETVRGWLAARDELDLPVDSAPVTTAEIDMDAFLASMG